MVKRWPEAGKSCCQIVWDIARLGKEQIIFIMRLQCHSSIREECSRSINTVCHRVGIGVKTGTLQR